MKCSIISSFTSKHEDLFRVVEQNPGAVDAVNVPWIKNPWFCPSTVAFGNYFFHHHGSLIENPRENMTNTCRNYCENPKYHPTNRGFAYPLFFFTIRFFFRCFLNIFKHLVITSLCSNPVFPRWFINLEKRWPEKSESRCSVANRKPSAPLHAALRARARARMRVRVLWRGGSDEFGGSWSLLIFRIRAIFGRWFMLIWNRKCWVGFNQKSEGVFKLRLFKYDYRRKSQNLESHECRDRCEGYGAVFIPFWIFSSPPFKRHILWILFCIIYYTSSSYINIYNIFIYIHNIAFVSREIPPILKAVLLCPGGSEQ